jgi:hypothetical protein
MTALYVGVHSFENLQKFNLEEINLPLFTHGSPNILHKL